MANLYNISIGISLANRFSAGIGILTRGLGTANAQARQLQNTFNQIKLQAAVGGVMLGLGVVGLRAFKGPIDAAKEYAHQLNIMNMAGIGHVDIATAIGAAWKNTSVVVTTTATQNLRALTDLRNVLGSMKDATWALPIVTGVGAAMASSSESKLSGNAQDIAFSMAKALDILGKAGDPKTFAQYASGMSKVVTAFQGRVTPKMFQSVFAYARQAKFGMSEGFIETILPTLMLEYASSTNSAGGGSRGVGPMLAAFYRWRNQGYISKKSMPELERLGLIGSGSALRTTTTGTTVGAMRGAGEQNFFNWVQQILVPAINKRFGGRATPQQMMTEINEVVRGNQLAAQLVLEFALKQKNFLRDAGIVRGAQDYRQAVKSAQANDPFFQTQALTAQWHNVLIQLGLVVLPLVIKLTIGFTDWLKALVPWMQKNQTLVAILVWSFAGLSASLAFGGTVLLLSAAFRGLALIMGLGGPLMTGVRLLAGATGFTAVTTAITGAGGLIAAFTVLLPFLAGAAIIAAGIYAYKYGIKTTPAHGNVAQHPSYMPDWMYKRGPGFDDIGKAVKSWFAPGGWLHSDTSHMKQDFQKAMGSDMGASGQWMVTAAAMTKKFLTTTGMDVRTINTAFVRSDKAAEGRNQQLIHTLQKSIHDLGSDIAKMKPEIYLDGRKISDAVTARQAKNMAKAVTPSPSTFNPKMHPAQP